MTERSENSRAQAPYRLDDLAQLAAQLHLSARRVDDARLDIVLAEGCVLTFSNLASENTSLVGFDGTPWHAHGIVQLLTGDDTYVEHDELSLLAALASGQLVVISQLLDGQLHDRWLAHENESPDAEPLHPGEELRVFRLPKRNPPQT